MINLSASCILTPFSLTPFSPIQVIETAKLPPGSVVPDGLPHGSQQAGHVSIGPNVPASTVRESIVETIPRSKKK